MNSSKHITKRQKRKMERLWSLLGLLIVSLVVIAAAEKAVSPPPPRHPDFDSTKITTKELTIVNPTSNAKLWARITYPADASAEKKCPAIAIIPSGLGFGSKGVSARDGYYASQGFLVAVFDPDGRGKSEGEENYNGLIHQDGLNALLKHLASFDFVQRDNIGVMTGSYGVALAAGALARYPGNPSIKYFIDNEGPTDRFYITVNNDPRFLQIFKGHRAEEADWWKEREAVNWAPKFPCRYLRVQQVLDHVHKENKQHAINIVNAATNTSYGGKGIAPWTRVNGPDDNPPNKVYTAENPPKWIEVAPEKRLERDLDHIKEMAAMPPLEVTEKEAKPIEAQKKRAQPAPTGSVAQLDDSPFGMGLFQPYESPVNGTLKNPVLVRGLAQPGPDGQLPEAISADVFFDFIGRNASELGVRWTRSDVHGGLGRRFVEQEEGRYDWTVLDMVIAAAKKRGVHTLVRITAEGAWDATAKRLELPSNIEAYRRFVRLGVERYDGDGVDDASGSPKVDCWQIGNEPDEKGFWTDTPENWAKLHRIIYEEIKAADPNAIIVIGGCANHPGLERFYSAMLADLARDGKRWFDIADFHFNHADMWPSAQGDYHGLLAGVKEYRAALEQNGFGYAPIWITECGGYSGSPPRGPRGELQSVTEHEHAVDLVHRYILALSLGVKKVFLLGMLDHFSERGRDNYFAHTGLIYGGRFDPPGAKFGDRKLAFYADKKMIEMLGDSDWNRVETVLDGSDGAFVIRFPHKSDGHSVLVVWTDPPQDKKDVSDWAGRNVKVKLKSGASTAVAVSSVPEGESGVGLKAENVVFKTQNVAVENGAAEVLVDATPVYIEE